MRQHKPGLIVLFLIFSDLSGTAVGLEYLLTRQENPLNWELPNPCLPFFQQKIPLDQRLATFDAFEIEIPDAIVEQRVKRAGETGQGSSQRLAGQDRVEVRWHYQDRFNTHRPSRGISRGRWAPAQNLTATMAKEQAAPAAAMGLAANSFRIPDLLVSLLLISICVLFIVQNRRVKYTFGFSS